MSFEISSLVPNNDHTSVGQKFLVWEKSNKKKLLLVDNFTLYHECLRKIVTRLTFNNL